VGKRGVQRGETVYLTHQEGWLIRQMIWGEIERIERSLSLLCAERANLEALRHLQKKLAWSESDGLQTKLIWTEADVRQLSGRDRHTDSHPF